MFEINKVNYIIIYFDKIISDPDQIHCYSVSSYCYSDRKQCHCCNTSLYKTLNIVPKFKEIS
jgi:hypothetical protein